MNGVLTLSANRTRLCPEGAVSLLTDGGGQVRFTGTGWDLRRINNIGNSTLTLGPGLLVHGGYAEIGPAVYYGGQFLADQLRDDPGGLQRAGDHHPLRGGLVCELRFGGGDQ